MYKVDTFNETSFIIMTILTVILSLKASKLQMNTLNYVGNNKSQRKKERKKVKLL